MREMMLPAIEKNGPIEAWIYQIMPPERAVSFFALQAIFVDALFSEAHSTELEAIRAGNEFSIFSSSWSSSETKNMVRRPRDVTVPAPQRAIVKGIAKGREGDRIGVYGESVSSPAVWANGEKSAGLYATSVDGAAVDCENKSAGGIAGRFTGRVEIAGSLTLNGNDVIGQLQQKIADLEEIISKMHDRISWANAPSLPVYPPNLPVGSIMHDSNYWNPQRQQHRFTLFYATELLKNSPIVLRARDFGSVKNEQTIGNSGSGGTIVSSSPLHFFVPHDAPNGHFYFAISDGRDDPNGLGGKLWSNTIDLSFW